METRWALWKRQDIMDIDDPDRVYLRRRRVITTPLFGVMLHKIMLPDGDRAIHDHPWPFMSLILKNGYDEQVPVEGRPGMFRIRAIFGWNYKKATGAHRIVRLWRDEPVYTIVFHGWMRRDWGFIVNGEWVDHETYLAAREMTDG